MCAPGHGLVKLKVRGETAQKLWQNIDKIKKGSESWALSSFMDELWAFNWLSFYRELLSWKLKHFMLFRFESILQFYFQFSTQIFIVLSSMNLDASNQNIFSFPNEFSRPVPGKNSWKFENILMQISLVCLKGRKMGREEKR